MLLSWLQSCYSVIIHIRDNCGTVSVRSASMRSWLLGWFLKISTIYLAVYLFTYLHCNSIPKETSLRIRGRSLLERALTSDWFSNPACIQWMWLQHPRGEIRAQSHCLGGHLKCELPASQNHMEEEVRGRDQADFVLGDQKSDSVGTRVSCERPQELLGGCVCGGG